MGRSQQRKGRAGEIEICRVFQAHGIPAEPGRPVSFGSTPDVTGVAGVHCEIKRCQQLRIGDWMKQATEDAQRFQDGAPTIFFRRNREPWMVCMTLEDWIQLYTKAQGCKCGGHCSAAKTSEKRKGGAENGT